MIDIRLPNLQGKSDSEKVRQLTSYIYQLAEQLNFHINTMDEEIKKAGSGSGGGSTVIIQGGGGSAGLDRSEVEAIVSTAISSSVSSAVNNAIATYYGNLGLEKDGTTLRTKNGSGLRGLFSGYTVEGELVEGVGGYLYTAINGQGIYYYVFSDPGDPESDPGFSGDPIVTFVSLKKTQ